LNSIIKVDTIDRRFRYRTFPTLTRKRGLFLKPGNISQQKDDKQKGNRLCFLAHEP